MNLQTKNNLYKQNFCIMVKLPARTIQSTAVKMAALKKIIIIIMKNKIDLSFVLLLIILHMSL